MAALGHRRLVRPGRFPRLTWRYFRWRYIDNFSSLLAYHLGDHRLSDSAEKVLRDLNRNGVAIASAQSLLGTDSCYDELLLAVDRLERDQARVIENARAAAVDTGNYKTFILELLGDRPKLKPESVFVRFPLQKSILQIINAYFEMYTRLRFYNVWHTFVTQLPPRESQLWHRDPEDNCVLKLFVYLSDVDEGAGPFTYAAGTHLKGGLRREPAYTRKKGDAKRSDDSQMAEVVSPNRWIKCLGPRGTLIFADTRGYHKGGFAQQRERILYTCMFTSQATKLENHFERPESISLPQDREQAFALTG